MKNRRPGMLVGIGAAGLLAVLAGIRFPALGSSPAAMGLLGLIIVIACGLLVFDKDERLFALSVLLVSVGALLRAESRLHGVDHPSLTGMLHHLGNAALLGGALCWVKTTWKKPRDEARLSL